MLGHSLVVVGDAHLAASSPHVEEALLAFLGSVPSLGDCLLLTGDLFDFWFGYARVIPRHGFHVAAAMAQLRKQMPIVMLGGNHDRWSGGFWQHDVGIDFAPHRRTFLIGRRRVLALHGDGLTQARRASNLLHRVVNHPLTAAMYRAIHPDVGIRLVERIAPYLSDGITDERQLAAAVDRQRAWAERTLQVEPELQLLIMAHTHRPALTEPYPGRQYLNSGAWIDGFRYAIATEHGAELRQFA